MRSRHVERLTRNARTRPGADWRGSGNSPPGEAAKTEWEAQQKARVDAHAATVERECPTVEQPGDARVWEVIHGAARQRAQPWGAVGPPTWVVLEGPCERAAEARRGAFRKSGSGGGRREEGVGEVTKGRARRRAVGQWIQSRVWPGRFDSAALHFLGGNDAASVPTLHQLAIDLGEGVAPVLEEAKDIVAETICDLEE